MIIAPAYKWVAEREAWATDTTNRAEIALLSVEAASKPQSFGVPGHQAGPDEGAVRVLLEGKFAFDVVDLESDYSQYRLLILPDAIAVDGSLKAKVEKFVAGGGKVLLTGKSGIDPESGFVFDVGAEWNGTSHNAGGDLRAAGRGAAGRLRQRSAVHVPAGRADHGSRTAPRSGEVYEPYFDRTPRHFSGHVNAPSKPDASALRRRRRARATSPISPSRSFPATTRSVRSRCWRSPRS